MKKNGCIVSILLILFLSVFLMSCPGTGEDVKDDDDKKNDNYVPVAIGTYTGTGVGNAMGFGAEPGYLAEHGYPGYRGITVTVEMKDGFMTSVTIKGPEETPGAGGRLVLNDKNEAGSNYLGPKVVQYNTFALDSIGVDGLSGATITFEGIKAAGNKAIELIKAGSN